VEQLTEPIKNHKAGTTGDHERRYVSYSILNNGNFKANTVALYILIIGDF